MSTHATRSIVMPPKDAARLHSYFESHDPEYKKAMQMLEEHRRNGGIEDHVYRNVRLYQIKQARHRQALQAEQ